MERTRRELLATVGATVVGGVAGCLSSPGGEGESGGPDGYTALFPLWDFGEQVSGDDFSFENPVETGRMGHGWSPDGNLTADIAAAELFVYLDTPEFAWAQQVADTLERDYSERVTVVDTLEGLESEMIQPDSQAHDDADTAPADGGGSSHDPHVWVDPVLAQQMVETITEALVDIDPANSERYDANAGTYREALQSVDRQFEDMLTDAELDVAVFAGHNSFRYLERRYGFSLETPVGTSPNAVESLDDIAGLVETIDEYDIETVLYDPFEAPDPDEELPQMVELILENTDATAAEPLTPVSGTTGEWAKQGWGWVGQMEQINIPSLERAFNPSD